MPRSEQERIERRLAKANRRIKRWTGDKKQATKIAAEHRVIERLQMRRNIIDPPKEL